LANAFTRSDSLVIKADRAAAIAWALGQAQAGDCVLIAGKGHEDYQQVGGTKHWFDDSEIARQWLYDHAVLPRELLIPLRQANVG
jgi:UDP-N-acetylmuramoyl-L-alanyl-D-glutamate--2,6-diaminopimelate ligase